MSKSKQIEELHVMAYPSFKGVAGFKVLLLHIEVLLEFIIIQVFLLLVHCSKIDLQWK